LAPLAPLLNVNLVPRHDSAHGTEYLLQACGTKRSKLKELTKQKLQNPLESAVVKEEIQQLEESLKAS